MDRLSIRPGQDWQDSIDSAIRTCTHMLVLLSAASNGSDEVEAEWAFAKDLGKVIVPILIEDVEVPYRLRKHQHVRYIDDLDSQLKQVLPVLPREEAPRIATSLPEAAMPDDYAHISFRFARDHDRPAVCVNPGRFSTLQTLLNELYAHYLSDVLKPFSYSSEWVLIGEPFHQGVIAPIEWVESTGKPVSDVAPDWAASTEPNQARILAGSRWEVVAAKPIGVGGLSSMDEILAKSYGVVTNNDGVARALTTNAKAIAILSGRFAPHTVAEATALNCRHKLVFTDWLNAGPIGQIGVDTKDDLSPEEAARYRW